jgi:uncharacterized membrane protein YhaH (DUF805 family)
MKAMRAAPGAGSMRARAMLFGFAGRIDRLAFLAWGLPAFAVALLVYVVLSSQLGRVLDPQRSDGVAGLAVLAAGFFPFAPLLAKRLHDIDCSGWWQLPLAAPEVLNSGGLALGLGSTRAGALLEAMSFAGGAGLAALALWPGTRGPNRFGAPSGPAR